MNIKKRSIIWTISKEQLQEYVTKSKAVGELLLFLGYQNPGRSYIDIKLRLAKDNIDTSHFDSFAVGASKITIPLENILVEKSSYNRSLLKKRLFNAGLLERKCSKCGLGEVYNNKPISLQIDHINGINDDNRIENLRILCPNCHTQTHTHGGKRFKKEKIKVKSTYVRPTKIDWKSYDLVDLLLESKTLAEMARRLNMSDNGLRKHLKKYNLPLSIKEIHARNLGV